MPAEEARERSSSSILSSGGLLARSAVLLDRLHLRRTEFPGWGFLAVFYLACVLAAALGQVLAIIPGVTITFWPPAGLFVVALLVSRQASWPWWILTACFAELTGNALWFANPLGFALIYFVANATEAVACALLLGRFAARPMRLETLRDIVVLVVCAGASATLAATIGTVTDVLRGKHALLTAWPLWWVGDTTGILVSAPFALVAVRAWRERLSLTGPLLFEGIALGLILTVTAILALKGYLPTLYVVLPPLLWIAARFQIEGAAPSVVLLAVLTGTFTAGGWGEFAADPQSAKQGVLSLQLFLAVAAFSALMVAALSSQHQRALRTLRAMNGELEQRVASRTQSLQESERRLAAILDALPIGVALVDREGRTVVGNEVYKGYVPGTIPTADHSRVALWEGHHADGRPIERHEYPAARALRGERVWPGQEFSYRGDPARGPFWTRIAALPFRDSDDKIIGATAVIVDIDREKRSLDALRDSEERLRTSEARYRTLLQLMPAAMCTCDATGRIVLYNDQAVAIWGRTPPTDGSERFCGSLRLWLPDGALVTDDIMPIVGTLSAGTRHREAEVLIERPDGSRVPVLCNIDPIRDGEGRIVGAVNVFLDISERKRQEAHTAILMSEVNHRAKNLLGLVQAIARQTAATNPKDFLERFTDRVQALSANQDLLVQNSWHGVDIDDLVRAQLSHFADLVGTRIELFGPKLRLTAAAAQAIGLALHELATNAGKYGALSNASGRVDIHWRIEGDRLHMRWAERGGPPVAPPPRKGFGTTVIDTMARLTVAGTVDLSYAPAGLTWQLDCPADRALEPGHAPDRTEPCPVGWP